jgi:signal transduction histidine kinase
MRSLALKLTLSFLLVGLIGAVVVSILVQLRTRRAFNSFLKDQYETSLVVDLTGYFQENGSWQGVATMFLSGDGAPQADFGSTGSPGEAGSPGNFGPGGAWDPRRALFTIADAGGVVIFGGGPADQGRVLGQSDLDNGIPLEVDGTTVGWLISTPVLDRWNPRTPEGGFLQDVNQALLWSALIATAIALILGGVLAYTLTRSVRELTAATKELAGGQFGHQVQVRSKDELGDLARSFNLMSTALARSTALRRKMTADIAHDLRTPLSVILGYTEALRDKKLDPDQEMYAVMHTEAQHLSRLVDDLKILALADAGELPLNYGSIAPGELLKRAADSYRIAADRARIAIHTEIAPGLPFVRVDGERMAQVLGNLMSNALRYTPPGGEIRLSADRTDGQVRLLVADTGPGIAAEDLPFIFERSFRGDQARQQQEGETGLGLAIAKSLVEAQDGAIAAESAPGAGTTFTIFLPFL